MSKEIKEAIEHLEKVDRHIIHHTCGYTVTQDLKTLKGYVQQALTKLREVPEQPPAGEFTKKNRQYFTVLPEELCDILVQKTVRHCSLVILEACDRLDKAEAEIKRLAKALDLCGRLRQDDHKKAVDELVTTRDYLTARAGKAETELRKWREREYCEDCNAKTVLSTGDIGCKSKKYIKDLETKLKTKDELLFAYESVSAPVNPLLSINKDLLTALEEIRDLETDCCPRCEGGGRIWADGKAHFPHEQVDTIPCGNCGGSGRILPEIAQDIAEAAIAKAKKQGD